MQILKELKQRSDEWYKIRQNKMTASNADKIVSGGNTLFNYCDEIVTEFFNGAKPHFISDNMQRGIDLEPTARDLANSIYNKNFEEVGAVIYNERCLVSPDGVVMKNDKIKELIEIKSPSDHIFQKVLNGYINPKYYAQIQLQLFVTGAEKCLFFNYNENVEPFYKGQWIKPDEEVFKKLETNLKWGADIIDMLLMKHFEAEENE